MATEMGMPENEDVRKKALLRLGVAGIVTVTALAGLWWLDQGTEKKKTGPIATSSPAPIVPAPISEAAPPRLDTPDTPPAPETEAPPATGEAGTNVPSEPPPPPRVSNAPAPSLNPPGQPAIHSSPAPTQAPPVAPAPTPSPALAARPPVQTVPAGKGFVVQLGVFGDPDNARELLEKLNKQGIRAHMESRVQMGPFLNRGEAERAQAEMRKLGYNALVTTAYPVK